ncbi:uncharacterized protein LOC117933920 [Vitis riparia]|uniref:uncharacterized protein LOC117933920 n=1 Tax=Vitis riparia TaxID=96939 RepID=UPI00155A19DA|nr:uncharacterized protein LOC117933920 [Vitis riparia]
MGFLRRIAGILGFTKDEPHETRDVDDENDVVRDRTSREEVEVEDTRLPRKGFSVPAQVVIERGPLLVPCTSGEGGVQGLKWYAKRLRVDEDGDVADEFIDEVSPDTSSSAEDHRRPLPRFQVNYRNRAAKVRNQKMSLDGKIQQGLEFQGRLMWV